MDTIIHAALTEICAQGTTGLSLSLLFPRLHSSLSSIGLALSPSVKRAVWSGLITTPGVQFKAQNGSDFDPNSKEFDEIEGLDLKVIGSEQLRRCFVGLYDVKSSNITPIQQRVLERLALARENGVTQNQLCKEFGIPANNFFYVVKRLEAWGLIVRHSTIVRTKEASGDKELKNSQPFHTNLIRLHRYALPLSSQQRLEITKDRKNSEEKFGENQNVGGDDLEECGQDDVLVKDFLPPIKAICDRLEQAEGKVLVVSDIKRELGYRETRGHRAWRNICNRLKQAGLVEVFEAKVDKLETPTKSKKSRSRGENKPVSCLRLLRKFSPKLFQQKTPDCEDDNLVLEQTIPSGKQVQNTEQLVELPLEQQIIDLIDAEGSKGLLGVDVCRRLGISTKMLDNLTSTLVSRFGLHQLSENRKRGSAYRFWTRGNFCPEFPNLLFNRIHEGSDANHLALAAVRGPSQTSQSTTNDTVFLNSQRWLIDENLETRDAEENLKNDSHHGIESGQIVACSRSSPGVTDDMSIIVHGSVSGTESTETSANQILKPFNLQEGHRYPSLTSAQREIRILERLKTESIIIKPELQRWLESFEKDNKTRMDRRTLTHCLKKLELDGKCKLMVFSIPGVTNCGQYREILVVLHPSVKGSASELSDQVHDKLRSFEMQVRGAFSQSKKEVPVPVLHGVERIQANANSATQNVKSEAMRANGFVLAKMVRTKLLHCFLWDCVNNEATCAEVSSSTINVNPSGNPRNSCLLFGLDAAIKAMPFELYLQVVGSSLKWTDMIEKCKTGMLLSDLPDKEYKILMDSRATGRLSWLIDILHRLKLIRLVADENAKDATKISHAKLIYALELKPYIEEPPLFDLLPRGSSTLDPRPHFRHNFVLSTSKDVEKYWQTLEYCYAAADPKAAICAFPGSVVCEVCLYRSWTAVRVMKAEQRAKLIKRIKDQQSKKLGFQECREIAKDLDLSLEQVLRVYYDNRRKHLNQIQGDVLDARSDVHPLFGGKRKTFMDGRSTKRAKVSQTSESKNDIEEENVEEPNEDTANEDQESLIGQCIMPMVKSTRKQKFSWTEEADRLLLIKYVRQRAMQGARRGTDWSSISDLPAPPITCRRRLSVLMRDTKLRKSLMGLCNLLTQRYAQQMDHESNSIVRDECQESDSQGHRWDDFDDSKIKSAFHEVLALKQMIKLDSNKRSESVSQDTHKTVTSPCEYDNDSERHQICSTQKSRCHRLTQKFVMHFKEGVGLAKRLSQSLAVSCAVELFKLVFLTNSETDEMRMPNLLAETLWCYSEHDLFSAFDYLRQKKFLIGSGPSQPFVLSQNFLRSLSWSQFPTNTAKRAAKLASWLNKKEKESMEGMVNLPSDLQCGDILYLFSLISSGEFSIIPVLPLDGVGEAEDSGSTKRKYDGHELDDNGVSKKQKCHSLQESEIFSRREKGFPGIKVSLSRATISRSTVVEFCKDEDTSTLLTENDQFYATLGQKVNCSLSHTGPVKEPLDFDSIVPATVISGDSLWEVITNYIIQALIKLDKENHVQLHPELIETIYLNIQKAGDQGLTMSGVSECLAMKSAMLAEHVVDVLQLFGLALKVNGFNSVHVVDAQYRSMYFLASKASCSQDFEMALSSDPPRDEMTVVEDRHYEHEVNHIGEEGEANCVNLSEDVSSLLNAVQAHQKFEECSMNSGASPTLKEENQSFDNSAATFQPILPWINGDGTINRIVYRGLRRRILGIVTQNPGIIEDDILCQMEVLNPQSCRKLLDLMVLDKHLIVRKMTQSTSSAPPALLENLFGGHLKKPKFVSREHYFANPMSCSLL